MAVFVFWYACVQIQILCNLCLLNSIRVAQICLFMLMWVLSNMMVHLPIDNKKWTRIERKIKINYLLKF